LQAHNAEKKVNAQVAKEAKGDKVPGAVRSFMKKKEETRKL
jgi:hypothetical protein